MGQSPQVAATIVTSAVETYFAKAGARQNGRPVDQQPAYDEKPGLSAHHRMSQAVTIGVMNGH